MFRATAGRPTLIIVDTHIGYGAPGKQDTAAAHGEPLGQEEVCAAKRFYGWPQDAHLLIPDGVREHFASGIGARGAAGQARWEQMMRSYRQRWPEPAAEIELLHRRELPAGWDADLPVFPPTADGPSSRESSGQVLNEIAPHVPWLAGGAADLAPSTKTTLTGRFYRTVSAPASPWNRPEPTAGNVTSGWTA